METFKDRRGEEGGFAGRTNALITADNGLSGFVAQEGEAAR